MLFSVAVAILFGGIALAIWVVPTRSCGMDEFNCDPTIDKFLTGVGALIAAFVVAVIAGFLER
jgi:hypothetical protein